MTINKLAIIGGSGLYDVEEFENRELVDLQTPWGKPSDQILKTKYKNKEVYFLPRHGRGHFISPSKRTPTRAFAVAWRTTTSLGVYQ